MRFLYPLLFWVTVGFGLGIALCLIGFMAFVAAASLL